MVIDPQNKLAMEAVQHIIDTQSDENRLTTKEAHVFQSAIKAFFSIAIKSGWPAATYFRSRDELLENGWVPQIETGSDLEPRALADNHIVRPQDRNFAFSETFDLVHPDQPEATITIRGSESHDGIDHENNLILIGLPRIFWNVSVITMSSKILWRASNTDYSKQASHFFTFNNLRKEGPLYNEDRTYLDVSGNSEMSCRDGEGNSFIAKASGKKLAAGETPITFTAKSYSRML